jgi:hypothetical protein
MTMRASTSSPLLSVYDGRQCVGFVLARGRRGFEAFAAGERSLGMLKTQNGAVNKIQLTANEEASVA